MPDANGEETPRGTAAPAPGGSPRTIDTVIAELDFFREMIHRLGRHVGEEGTPIPLGRPVTSAQQEDRDRRWAAQREHARTVLMRLLSPENRKRLANREELIIKGSRGTIFHVYPGDFSGNIRVLKPNGNTDEEWCVHPDLYDLKNDWYMPSEYAVAVQIVALQTDEAKARRIANVEEY